ncbi:MAG: VCBS repeat-containing protein [Acidobacteria bacterium]|nr:VCBS repeat-containing protein [Acidobacteriota bacterium]
MKRYLTIHPRTTKIAAMMAFAFVFCLGVGHSNQNGPIPGVAGIPQGDSIYPAEPGCDSPDPIGGIGCHVSFPVNPDSLGSINFLAGTTAATMPGVPPATYTPGMLYVLQVRVASPEASRRRWGFQVAAIQSKTHENAGNLVVGTGAGQTLRVVDMTRGNRVYIGHGLLGTAANTTQGKTWNFRWTAPAADFGDVDFYGTGNAANNDSLSLNDKIYGPHNRPMLVSWGGQYKFSDEAAKLHLAGTGSQGSAVADVKKDGIPDVLLLNNGGIALYEYEVDYATYHEITEDAKLSIGAAVVNAATFGDYDGDGDQDLYLVNVGADLLFRNNGDGTFTDASEAAGISDAEVGHSAAWGDLNGDGKLSLYVANDGQDILYTNKGDGTFTKGAAGTEMAVGWSTKWCDYDGDGKLDIVVANTGQNFLYKNNGDGTFTESSLAAGINTADVQGRAVAYADYNLDGNLDIFFGNVGADLLFRNNGNGTFTNASVAALGPADNSAASGASWQDYDSDGFPDLFVANTGQDFLYRNRKNGTFVQVAVASGLTDTADASGATWFDSNSDQKVDLLVTNNGSPNFLYNNPGGYATAGADVASKGLSGFWQVASLLGLIPLGFAAMRIRARRKRA